MQLTRETTNDIGMPLMGFGVFQLSPEEAESSVYEAIKAGYRHFESSVVYRNEDGMGRGMKASGINREELYVTTKAWSINLPNAYEQTKESLRKQLRDLQLDYVDLYLIHAPMSAYRLEQWRALVDLKKDGLVRHIGVSNYDVERLEEIRHAGMPMPELDEIEFHPLSQEKDVDRYLDEHGINKLAYSSLVPLSTWRNSGEGIGALKGRKEECGRLVDEIAQTKNATGSQVLLRYGMQHGYGTLARSRNPKHIQENMQIFHFNLSDEDMARLDAFDTGELFAWASSGMNPMKDVPDLAKV